MESEFPSSADTSLEMPSMIEAISSSIDDSCFNFEEFEHSTGEASTTTESDYMEVDSNWSQQIPQQTDQYNQNYYQQQQQWNYQQGYSQYPQYGYMTPSPYNSYYTQSPPVDYHHNYAYNTNMMTNYEQQQQQQQPYMFTGTQTSIVNPQDSEYSCNICIRSFKSSSNLTRHFMSKTHLKRLESKKQNSKVTIIRTKKPRVHGIGSSFTDISKDERAFLWQLDDEIFQFLKVYDEEQLKNEVKQDLALPTPPLSPNSRANEDKKVNSDLIKTESVITIASSSENIQGSPLSVRSSSVDSVVELPEMIDSGNVTSNNGGSLSSTVESANNRVATSNYTNSIPNNGNYSDITSKNLNCDKITSNNANYRNITSNDGKLSDITSKSANSNDINSNNSNFGNITSNNEQLSEIASKTINTDNITLNDGNYGNKPSNNDQFSTINSQHLKSEDTNSNNVNKSQITSNNMIERSATHVQSSQANQYQTNSISTNLTSDFSNMTTVNNEYGYTTEQALKACEVNTKQGNSTSNFESSSNQTSNYENYNSPSPHGSYYSMYNISSTNQSQTNNGSSYQVATSYSIPISTNSSHLNPTYSNSSTTTNVAFSPRNTEISSNTVNSIHQTTNIASSINQTTNNTTMENITSKSDHLTNITSNVASSMNTNQNNFSAIKEALKTSNLPNKSSNYQVIATIPTSVNKATTKASLNIQNSQIQQNKATTNRIITINPSALTRTATTTSSGLRIISVNQNITSNNGASKNPTTYTLMSSNSNDRYINATNLIGNNVKIQQISPNGIKNFRIVNNSHQALQNKVKIPHSSYNVQQQSPDYGQSSQSYGQNSPKGSNQVQCNGNQQQIVAKNCAASPSSSAEQQFLIPNSPSTPSSPTVLIQQETGEKYEIIFSDENFGDNFR